MVVGVVRGRDVNNRVDDCHHPPPIPPAFSSQPARTPSEVASCLGLGRRPIGRLCLRPLSDPRNSGKLPVPFRSTSGFRAAECPVGILIHRMNGLPRGIRPPSSPAPFPMSMAVLLIPSSATYLSADINPDAPVFPPKPLLGVEYVNHRDDGRIQDFELKPKPRVGSDGVGSWSHVFQSAPTPKPQRAPSFTIRERVWSILVEAAQLTSTPSLRLPLARS